MGAIDFIDELKWRGLLYQCTDEQGLREHLAAAPAGGRAAYAGFDPTADSLTIGNLVPIMALRHLQRAGHRPVVLMGGGTGLIGDPSGKSAERQLQTREQVEANVASQRRIFQRLLDLGGGGGGKTGAMIVNNADWLTKLSYIEVLRDVGKHFSVNMMIQKESIRARLEEREHGISYTEFSYMILQAYDFLHLFREHGVTVQLGGSDQWGNIVAGADLIRRQQAGDLSPDAGGADPAAPQASGLRPQACFGLTVPLVTKADGGKFGKTESGAIWLTADRTSPYAYYQFWLNTLDADVVRFLKIFTQLDQDQINALALAHASNPGAREAHRALAREATTLLYGKTEMEHAEAAARALFSGDVRSIPPHMMAEVFAAAPTSDHDKQQLSGEGVALIEILATTIADSKGQARKLLEQGAITINGEKAAPDRRLTSADLLDAGNGGVIALRRGKKTWHITRWK